MATTRNTAMIARTILDWSRVGAAPVSGGQHRQRGSSGSWSSTRASSRLIRRCSARSSAARRRARRSAALSAGALANVPTRWATHRRRARLRALRCPGRCPPHLRRQRHRRPLPRRPGPSSPWSSSGMPRGWSSSRGSPLPGGVDRSDGSTTGGAAGSNRRGIVASSPPGGTSVLAGWISSGEGRPAGPGPGGRWWGRRRPRGAQPTDPPPGAGPRRDLGGEVARA